MWSGPLTHLIPSPLPALPCSRFPNAPRSNGQRLCLRAFELSVFSAWNTLLPDMLRPHPVMPTPSPCPVLSPSPHSFSRLYHFFMYHVFVPHPPWECNGKCWNLCLFCSWGVPSASLGHRTDSWSSPTNLLHHRHRPQLSWWQLPLLEAQVKNVGGFLDSYLTPTSNRSASLLVLPVKQLPNNFMLKKGLVDPCEIG